MTPLPRSPLAPPLVVRPKPVPLEGPGSWLLRDPQTGELLPNADKPRGPAIVNFDEDLIPDPGPTGTYADPYPTLKEELHRIGIVELYRRWCGKMEPRTKGRTESIMVSCPFPGHEDRDPSAWLNSDKDAGNCAMCGGFDVFHLWAITHGYSKDDCKGQTFNTIKTAIAQELGLAVVKSATGDDFVVPLEEAEEDEDEDDTEPSASVSILTHDDDDLDDKPFIGLPIEWRTIFDQQTAEAKKSFMQLWMETYTQSDAPEEMIFWAGLVAVSMAVGNDAVLFDPYRPVRANLLVCLLGSTGTGKSFSIGPAIRTVRETFPWNHGTSGVVAIDPESSQAIQAALVSRPDPTDPQGQPGATPVRLLLHIDEFSSLISRGQRTGSTMKQAIQGLYDSPDDWGTTSKTSTLPQARGHFVSAVAGTQPGVLSELLDRRDARDGFLNRWIYGTGIPKPPVARHRTSIPVDQQALEDRLRGIRNWALNGGDGRVLDFSPAADQIWEDFFHRRLARLRGNDAFARIELVLKKLALLLAANTHKAEITEGVMLRTLQLYDYLFAGYKFVSGETKASQIVKESDEIERVILRMTGKHPMTTKGVLINKAKNSNPGMAPLMAWHKHFDSLVLNGDIIEVAKIKRDGPGRPFGPYYHLPGFDPDSNRKAKP